MIFLYIKSCTKSVSFADIMIILEYALCLTRSKDLGIYDPCQSLALTQSWSVNRLELRGTGLVHILFENRFLGQIRGSSI